MSLIFEDTHNMGRDLLDAKYGDLVYNAGGGVNAWDCLTFPTFIRPYDV